MDDQKNILFVKNMVCGRCIRVVREDLENLGVEIKSIILGEVETAKPLTQLPINRISETLQQSGFELIEDNKAKIIEKIKTKIYDSNYKMANRASPKDFTRERKMPFSSLVLFMLNIIKQTLKKELANFMDLVSGKTSITKSAFSQSRVKLKPEAFVDLNEVLVEEFYTDNITKKWNGFRLCAIEIGRAHVGTPVTFRYLVCRLLLEKKKKKT